ncbi:hypothetical protein QWY15_19440 [Planococcus sp. N064]|uniref:Uncharacterized protein n=1 Tax=Planococcus liqunii TaxID=3058394 RepID=A0ABT8MXJ6_9BACL|nr:hypothetical protein [Planococcus sp. N064]MDN7229435.1 hypothetical protein [Planococcus sp. N064]
MPTQEWKNRMDDGDDQFSTESIAAAEKVLQSYIDGISRLQEPTEEELMKKVKEVVLRLNAVNEEYDFFIETLEREELCEFILEHAKKAGMVADEDITEEWREW